jgi:phosphohistidine phosphatase SixA
MAVQMRPWQPMRRGRAAVRSGARPMVASVVSLLLAVVVVGCGRDQPAPAGQTGSASLPARAERPRDSDLIAGLRRGGHVIFIRHAATDATADDPMPDLADPSTQRNLSDAGRKQAAQLGRAIRHLRIPIGTVLVSPYARTRKTGELAFGRSHVRETRELLNEAFPGTDDQELARHLRRLLAARPPAGRNTVLVSHGFNLNGATGLSIQEGESVIFRPEEGRSRLVARLTVEQWRALARHG